VKGGKNGKSQGIEGSANANDVWVWMRPHIQFCTIGKYDLLSFFPLIESLPAACKFHPLFFSFETWSFFFAFQSLLPFFFFFFLRILLFAWKRFHSLEFSRRITW
jgi:hypothetical protein